MLAEKKVDAYHEGHVAALDGHDITDNPYNLNLQRELYVAWNEGYIDAE